MKIFSNHKSSTLIIFCISCLLSGCAKTIFFWGDYEDSLYERYVENDPQQAYVKLNRTIVEGESQIQRLAPGIYADYGFLLFQRGDTSGAIQYFLKEKQQYPESTALMNKLISKIEEKQKGDKSSVEPKTVSDRVTK